MKHYPEIINALNASVWAILPDKMEIIMRFLSARLVDGATGSDVPEVTARERKPVTLGGGIAVVPILGTICQRMDSMTAISGGTSTTALGRTFDNLVADPQVSAIILESDSPGGSVYGLEELATKIRQARGQKPVVAIANSLMASAAYYIGSAADEISVTPGGQVGSVGTIAVHVDKSGAAEKAGLKYTLIKAGDNKGLGNTVEPLSDKARDVLQGMVNNYYRMFVDAVAANRGISADQVEANYGQGKVYTSADAVRHGLADRVETMEQLVGRLSRRVRNS
jgi:signal peptide peptidase SppA